MCSFLLKNSFTDKFIGAKDIVWNQSPKLDWKATFYMAKFHYMTEYDTPKGDFAAFEIKLHNTDIPENLASRIGASYPNATVFDVFELNTEHRTEYIFELVNMGQLFGIYFHNNGGSSIIPPDDYRFTSRMHIENDLNLINQNS